MKMNLARISGKNWIKLLLTGSMLIPLLTYAQAWKSLKDVPVKLAFPVVLELDGNIHVIGGGGPNGASQLHLRYLVKDDRWDTLAPVPYKAQQPGGAVVGGEIHYFGGGYPNSGTRLDDHYAYHPPTNSWRKQADLPIPRVIHKTAVLDEKIYVMSGQPDKSRVDIFNKADSSWSSGGNLPDGNFWYSGIAVHQQSIYRFGGGGSTSSAAEAHLFNSASEWTSLPSLLTRNHAPAAAVMGDSIYIIGGYADYRYTTQCLVFNTSTQIYGKGPSLPEGRSYHSAVTVGKCIYSVGGHNDNDQVGTSLIRHCLGDPFSNLGITSGERQVPTVYFNGDGNLAISGLKDYTGPAVVQLFDHKGMQLLSAEINHGEEHLELSTKAFPAGIYTVAHFTPGSMSAFKVFKRE